MCVYISRKLFSDVSISADIAANRKFVQKRTSLRKIDGVAKDVADSWGKFEMTQ
jgi:hypothetical protein